MTTQATPTIRNDPDYGSKACVWFVGGIFPWMFVIPAQAGIQDSPVGIISKTKSHMLDSRLRGND